MGLLLFIMFGFFVGLIARALMPGNQSMGLALTTILGVAGSFTGGLLTSLITHHSALELHPAGFIGSVVGALVLLFVAGGLLRSRVHV